MTTFQFSSVDHHIEHILHLTNMNRQQEIYLIVFTLVIILDVIGVPPKKLSFRLSLSLSDMTNYKSADF